MGKTYRKDIRRFILKGKKRFLSLMTITILGVTMLTGLKATCDDLRRSADQLYDDQKLYDICIQSTLGLTADDVAALEQIDGVSAAGGVYTETAKVPMGTSASSIQVKTLIENGINQPYVTGGRLPEAPNEAVVSENFLQDSGFALGDDVDLQLTEDTALLDSHYTIVGAVIDPANLNQPDGPASFRASSADAAYTFFIPSEAVDSDIYTALYLTVENAASLNCYSTAYQQRIAQTMDLLSSSYQTKRRQARLDQVQSEALETFHEEEKNALAELDEAEQKLLDAKAELADHHQTLMSAQAELEDQRQETMQKLSDAKAEIESGKAQLQDALKTLEASSRQLSDQEAELAAAREQLSQTEKETLSQLADAQNQLQTQLDQASAALPQLSQQEQTLTQLLPAWPETQWQALINAAFESASHQIITGQEPAPPSEAQNAFLSALTPLIETEQQAVSDQLALLDPAMPGYAEQYAALAAKREQLNALPQSSIMLAMQLGSVKAAQAAIPSQLATLSQKQEQAQAELSAAWSEIFYGEAQIQDGKKQLESGYQEITEQQKQLSKAETLLKTQEAEAYAQLDEAQQTITDGLQQWEEGQTGLLSAEAEYQDEKEKALQQLSDARQEIDSISLPTWYIQSRDALSSYTNIQSDADSIEAVGTAFPIVFFLVAVLISLTTITRLVEEERSLIGTYQSLGYSHREILRKYWIYALLACLLGGLIGDICGFILLPKILFSVFRILYQLPQYQLFFNPLYGLGGILLFTAGILAATIWTCMAQVKQKPASAMRPKAPQAGSRILLERLPFFWKRLSFLNKVTARNLFRYKKRLLMTIFGIAGCTALVLCALAIKDSVADLVPNQYDRVQKYDLLTVTSEDEHAAIGTALEEEAAVVSSLPFYIDSVKLINESGEAQSMQLMVFPDDASLSAYFGLTDLSGQPVSLSSDGALVTQNASQILDFTAGARLALQNSHFEKQPILVQQIVENYLGNTIFMTQSLYQSLFEEGDFNAFLSILSEDCTDPVAFSDQVGEWEGVLSTTSTDQMQKESEDTFFLIKIIVYIILAMAAGLAMVVLFTLSTTNISERIRELATIKVLGFHPSEVHRYVNKEMLILTLLGILLGIPLGHWLSGYLTYVLVMPSIYFAVSIHPISYGLAAALSFFFALIVNWITNHTLDRINMVEAMKSVE